ncbi:THO complex subunit 4 [Hyalella azteca]|uniref:THO complex subunit 4 n=1 Tax=Hyalella azteca TaxID=294128 RepID=A0A8B7NGA9_HYAAZ|nr:THO complex subunit 4 [Hyalella azteca]
MDSKLDMALDDIISKKKGESRGGGSGRRGSRGGGGGARGRGGRGGNFSRPAPYNTGPRQPQSSMGNGRWTHDMFRGGDSGLLPPPPLMGMGTFKLNINNLDFGVTDSDIRELFQEFGDMQSAAVHYDRSGRSLGSAQVIFGRQSDAVKAMKQYNGVHLDGRPMKIYIEGLGLDSSFASRGGGVSRPMSNRLDQRSRGSRPGGRGRGGRGRQPEKAKLKTAEELDAELDSYLCEAKKAK